MYADTLLLLLLLVLLLWGLRYRHAKHTFTLPSRSLAKLSQTSASFNICTTMKRENRLKMQAALCLLATWKIYIKTFNR